ncbi:MAG: Phosphatidylserine decarboxylase proenzyme [Phycisphaerae bacterium]|nr:Phosphatidylserine decarboxylase proenzyme [Phycisphaerae bacterium]
MNRMLITRYGRWEVLIGTAAWLGLSALSCLFIPFGWTLSILWSLLWLWLVAFFRNPPRTIPRGPGLLVAPADGKITDITELEGSEFLNCPAVRIGIFLNVFNVHINRSPAAGTVDYVNYKPGLKVNAMRADAGEVNESCAVGLRDTEVGCPLLVRQIAGLIARRIVCDTKVGQPLERGQIFGMIKFGSRTELIVPRSAGLLVDVMVGQKVRAGRDVLARVTEVMAADASPVGASETA